MIVKMRRSHPRREAERVMPEFFVAVAEDTAEVVEEAAIEHQCRSDFFIASKCLKNIYLETPCDCDALQR